MPCPSASRAHASAATWAANGVLLREPLNPTLPALAHVTTLPSRSAIVMIVLLKLACTWATPFEPTLRSRFFAFLTSATRNLHRARPETADHCVGSVARRCDVSQIRLAPRSLAALSSAVSGRADHQPGLRGAGLAAATGFFITPAVFFGPFLVRALVRVRWPRTGSPRRCRRPRYAPMSIRRFTFIAISLRS